MELELTVSGAPGDGREGGAVVEPCELCGTPVQLVDPMLLVRFLAGMPEPPEEHRTFHEVHQRVADGEASVSWRPHTPYRCRRVRAGDPEPLGLDEEGL